MELEWALGLMVYIMDRCLLSLQLVLKNQRPILTLYNQLLLVLPLLEKKVFLYTDDLVNDSSPIILSNESLSSINEVETTKASSERVDRGTP